MSPKKGYMENGGIFYLGTHLKCAGTVTFILLLTQSWQGEGGGGLTVESTPMSIHEYLKNGLQYGFEVF